MVLGPEGRRGALQRRAEPTLLLPRARQRRPRRHRPRPRRRDPRHRREPGAAQGDDHQLPARHRRPRRGNKINAYHSLGGPARHRRSAGPDDGHPDQLRDHDQLPRLHRHGRRDGRPRRQRARGDERLLLRCGVPARSAAPERRPAAAPLARDRHEYPNGDISRSGNQAPDHHLRARDPPGPEPGRGRHRAPGVAARAPHPDAERGPDRAVPARAARALDRSGQRQDVVVPVGSGSGTNSSSPPTPRGCLPTSATTPCSRITR